MPPAITEETVKAVMSAIEEETIGRAVAICREYAQAHAGSRKGKRMAGTATHLAKIIEAMKRKSP